MKPGAMQLAVTLRLAYSAPERLDQADHSGLRRRVVGLAGIAGHADDRGDRDDPAEALAHHQLGRGAGETEGRGQVDLDDVVPVLVTQLHEQVVARDAGVGDQDIDLPHRGFRRGHQRLDFRAVGQIARQHVNAFAKLAGEGIQHLAARAGNAPPSRPARATLARSRRRCRRSRRLPAPSCPSNRTSMSPSRSFKPKLPMRPWQQQCRWVPRPIRRRRRRRCA